MLKKLCNMKKDKKGFTLVELIVVLIILAILAALLVPALTGYIDKAKEKQIIAETRQTIMAAQTILDEDYAKGTTHTALSTTAGAKFTQTEINKLAEVTGEITAISITGAKITSLTYKNTGKQCVYTAEPGEGQEKYKVSDATT